MYACEILADSISDHGHRLTTFQVTYPRIVLAEMNTHRVFSRNTSSSRAIPVSKQIQRVCQDPFIPEAFGKNQKGMVAETTLHDNDGQIASDVWGEAIYHAIAMAGELVELDVHKQLANRVIEPYTWTTQIITATDWDNFSTLRCAPDAQPEINKIAVMMQEAYDKNTPSKLPMGHWHLPLLSFEEHLNASFDQNWEYLSKVSIGRCARTSYLTHDGKRDPEADIALYDRLWESGHLSPFEHVARPLNSEEWDLIYDIEAVLPDGDPSGFTLYKQHQSEYVGNLRGWVSARMEMEWHISPTQ